MFGVRINLPTNSLDRLIFKNVGYAGEELAGDI